MHFKWPFSLSACWSCQKSLSLLLIHRLERQRSCLRVTPLGCYRYSAEVLPFTEVFQSVPGIALFFRSEHILKLKFSLISWSPGLWLCTKTNYWCVYGKKKASGQIKAGCRANTEGLTQWFPCPVMFFLKITFNKEGLRMSTRSGSKEGYGSRLTMQTWEDRQEARHDIMINWM